MFAQSLSVSPNPVCVGQTITVTLTGVCYESTAESTLERSVQYGNINIPLSENSDGSWSGTYNTTTQDAGTDTVTADDDGECNDQFNQVSLTVVELDSVNVNSEPTGSGWSEQIMDTSGYNNNVALKSDLDDDVVTFGLNMIPDTAAAATLITWNGGGTPSSDNLTATLPADDFDGPRDVSASISCCDCETDPLISWIMWGEITYNCSGGFDTNDALDFGVVLGFTNVPGGNKVAGDCSGTETLNGIRYCFAMNKVEIIGTLYPSGVGAVVGNRFTFNPQIKSSSPVWSSSTEPDSSMAPSLTKDAGNDGNLPQQTTPISDKIFALDDPGYALPVGNVYLGMACNFTNYIYIGSEKASDAGQWYSHTQTRFDYPTVTDITHNASSGSPTLPTTWGDTSW
jgi:hypothetical protein